MKKSYIDYSIQVDNEYREKTDSVGNVTEYNKDILEGSAISTITTVANKDAVDHYKTAAVTRKTYKWVVVSDEQK